MISNQERARWLARWAGMGMEAAAYLRDRGDETNGVNLERAVNRVLDLAAADVGEDVLAAAMQEISDLWCDGHNLPDDFFAGAVENLAPGNKLRA